MKSRTIRYLVVLTLLACTGIIVLQVYGLKRAYELQQETFSLGVNKALGTVAEHIWQDQKVQRPAFNPIEQLSKTQFVVQINVPVDTTVLRDYLVSELSRQNVKTDFVYFLSDCTGAGNTGTTGYYHVPGTNEKETSMPPFPALKRENIYFGVFFPHRKEYLATQLNVWIISSAVLVCIMGFLAYLLVVIFQQKRLSEIQKGFVSNMTHEFKTPLSSIALSAEVLRNPDIVRQPQRLLNYATIIANEASQLTAQVERVLQMAQIEKGVRLKQEDFVWQDLIKEEAESMKLLASQRDLNIKLEMPEAPIPYNGDILHLKNAISNLLDNAIKYCDSCPDIVVKLWKDAKHIYVSVKDNGIGIDPQHQKLLFEKFYRVPTGDVHNVKGFGLGLNYVKLIARAHGGTISCQSSLGKGSIFTLTFPLYKA